MTIVLVPCPTTLGPDNDRADEFLAALEELKKSHLLQPFNGEL